MKKITELILHCLDAHSDKVYIFEIHEKTDFYFLSSSWGKREAVNLASQIKGRFALLTQATNEMNRLANKKKRKGYVRAALDLKIPGHIGLDYDYESPSSGTMIVETKGDTELGYDEYGNAFRDIL